MLGDQAVYCGPASNASVNQMAGKPWESFGSVLGTVVSITAEPGIGDGLQSGRYTGQKVIRMNLGGRWVQQRMYIYRRENVACCGRMIAIVALHEIGANEIQGLDACFGCL